MYRFPQLISAAATVAFCLSGCSTPKHTDLLIFGTNTEFGASVKTNATSDVGLNIGFHRQEVVLMPLYVNGADSTVTPPTSDPKYQGKDSGARTDTYSVLASFGAKGSASTGSGAGVTIAQYFATGLAARTLALAGGALVTTSETGARQAISPAALSAEKSADIRKWITSRDAQVAQIADKLCDAATGKVDAAKLKKALGGIAGAPDDAGLTSIQTREDLIQELDGRQYDYQMDQILKNASS